MARLRPDLHGLPFLVCLGLIVVVGGGNRAGVSGQEPARIADKAEGPQPQVPMREIAPGVRLFGNVPPFAEAGHVSEVVALPDGKRILTISREGLFVFDLESGKKTGTLEPPPGEFATAWVSPDRSTIAVFSVEWVPGNAEHPEPKTTQHHLTWYCPDLNETGHLTLEPEQFDKDDHFLPRAWAFSPDGRRFALACLKRQFVIDLVEAELVATFREDVVPAVILFSSDSRRLILSADKPVVLDVDAQRWVPPDDCAQQVAGAGLRSLLPDAEHRIAFASDREGKHSLINLANGRPIGQFKEQGMAQAAAISPDGRLVAAIINKSDMQRRQLDLVVWQTANTEEVCRIRGVPGSTCEFSHDGRKLILPLPAIPGVEVIELPATGGEPRREIRMPSAESLAFVKNGGEVALNAISPPPVLLNTATGEIRGLSEVLTGVVMADGMGRGISSDASGNRLFGYKRRSGGGFQLSELDLKSGALVTRAEANSHREPDVVRMAMNMSGIEELPIDSYYPIRALGERFDASGEGGWCLFHDCRKGIMLQSWDAEGRGETRTVQSLDPVRVFPQELDQRLASDIARTGCIGPEAKWAAFEIGGQLHVVDPETSDRLSLTDAFATQTMIAAADGLHLALIGRDRIEVREAMTGETVWRRDIDTAIAAFAQSAPRLLVAPRAANQPAILLDSETWEVIGQRDSSPAERTACAISSDGNQAAFSLADGRLELWDVERMK